MNFLEGAYIVPTGLGLPLNLTATAVAAFNLQMETQVQLDKLFTEKKLDLALHIKPRYSTHPYGNTLNLLLDKMNKETQIVRERYKLKEIAPIHFERGRHTKTKKKH